MIRRRQFLIEGIGALGAWMVGATAARQILRLSREKREPYLVEVDDPVHELWANWDAGECKFTLDCPYTDMSPPQLTWREWLEQQDDVDIENPAALRDFLEDWGWYVPGGSQVYVPPQLDAKLPDELQDNYECGEWTMLTSPTALAFHYLRELRLADREARGAELGALQFIEGQCPGSNATLVTTSDVEMLGGLQQRLLQLGERVRIRSVEV
jgi:hypothetical protein